MRWGRAQAVEAEAVDGGGGAVGRARLDELAEPVRPRVEHDRLLVLVIVDEVEGVRPVLVLEREPCDVIVEVSRKVEGVGLGVVGGRGGDERRGVCCGSAVEMG